MGGFETRDYPVTASGDTPRQTLYLGVSVNLQPALARVFCPSLGREMASGFFEAVTIPYTTLRVLDTSRASTLQPMP